MLWQMQKSVCCNQDNNDLSSAKARQSQYGSILINPNAFMIS